MIHPTEEALTTEQLFGRTKSRLLPAQKKAIAITVIAIIFWLGIILGWYRGFENGLLDLWLSRPQKTTNSPIALIQAGDKSYEAAGHQPGTPLSYAIMIELLARKGARGVILDETFDDVSAEELKPLIAVLAKQEIPVWFPVKQAMLSDSETHGLGLLETNNSHNVLHRPNSALNQWIRGMGHAQWIPDQDQIYRFWKSAIFSEEKSIHALPLELLNSVRDVNISLSARTEWIFPWNRNDVKHWLRVEYSDLIQEWMALREGMQHTPNLDKIRDHWCFIGRADSATPAGLTPWRATFYPWQMNAVIFSGLKDKKPLCIAPSGAQVGFGIFFSVILFAASFFLSGRKIIWGWLAAGISLPITAGIFMLGGFWMPLAAAVLFWLASGLVVLIFDLMSARKEKSALFHLATRDGLTGLYVIRHFRVILNQITRESLARKEPLCVILMDIDHFKKINDTHGHPAGDYILKSTAAIIQSAVRQRRSFGEIDFLARYGGEEFILLIRRVSIERVRVEIAERIRKKLEDAEFLWQGQKIPVTVSLGVAALHMDESLPDAMVHRADQALYVAKRAGRNRVCSENEVGEENKGGR